MEVDVASSPDDSVRPAVLAWLRERGFDSGNVSAERDDVSSLRVAAHCGATDVVRFLVEHKAELEAEGCVERWGHDRFTAVQFAARAGHVAIVEILLKAGAKPNPAVRVPPAAEQESALSLAAASGHCAIMKLLLQHGADLAVGRSALCSAISFNKMEACELLLQARANPEQGRSAMRVAIECGHAPICRLLFAHGASQPAPALNWAVTNGHVDVLKFLVEVRLPAIAFFSFCCFRCFVVICSGVCVVSDSELLCLLPITTAAVPRRWCQRSTNQQCNGLGFWKRRRQKITACSQYQHARPYG